VINETLQFLVYKVHYEFEVQFFVKQIEAIHVEIYYATCSLNQWIDNLPIRNREQQSDHIYYTLLRQVLGFGVLLTRLSNLCKKAGPKPF
jgi:hypothetical protein